MKPCLGNPVGSVFICVYLWFPDGLSRLMNTDGDQ